MTNIGTIPDEAKVVVKIGDHKIGTLDEIFLERLRKGDVFVLGGHKYEFKFARGMTAQVASAEKRPPTVPSWFSEMLPLSFDLAMAIQRFRKAMEEHFNAKKTRKEIQEFLHAYLYIDAHAASALYQYFNEQYQYTQIPHSGKLVVEQYREESKTHFVFHALFGRRANDALSRAYGYVLGKLLHKDVEINLNDNGFVLSIAGKADIEHCIRLVKSHELRKLMEISVRGSEILTRRFRHCATRALMILRTYRGQTKSVGRQQMSARLLLSAVMRISEDFSILKEARREVLEDAMDIHAAIAVVQAVEQGKLKIVKTVVSTPSPFAFTLFTEGISDVVKIEGKLAFIQRMHARVLKEIASKNKE